jgi:FkbM family methyltransferase
MRSWHLELPRWVYGFGAPGRWFHRYAPTSMPRPRSLIRVTNGALRRWQHQYTCRTGLGFRMQGRTDDLIQRYVYLFGVWEPNLTAWIVDRLRPGDAFIDVGANVGYYTLLAATRVGAQGSVVALEPSPEVRGLLQANIALNGLTNVRVLPMAASDEPGVVELYDSRPQNRGAASIVAPRGEHSFRVIADRLENLVHAEEMARVRIIKIDVEGGELRAIRGLLPLLSHARDDLEIVVEISPDLLRVARDDPDEIFRHLTALGFCSYRIPNDYEAQSYLQPISRAVRFHGHVDVESDIIFSRQRSEVL